ncbi:Puratrophin-1-like [Carabus blaptoides fortunei]
MDNADNEFSAMNSEAHFSKRTISSSSFRSATNISSTNIARNSQDFDVTINNLYSDIEKKLNFTSSRLEQATANGEPVMEQGFKPSLFARPSNFPKPFGKPMFQNSSSDFPAFSGVNFGSSLSDFSFSSQFGNTSMMTTTASKRVSKRIRRRIVNGQLVEEEEEYDEIENEPTTEHTVLESSSDSSLSGISADGQNFFITQSKSCPTVNSHNEVDVRNCPKALEAPPNKTTQLKNILNIGKKKNSEKKNVGKIEPIINELLSTEDKYVTDLSIVVEEFMQELKRPDVPTPLKTCSHLLFGNIEIISNFHAAQFFPNLRDSDKTPRDIAICFLKNRKEFSLYRQYNRNKHRSDIFLKEYQNFFMNKIKELHSSLDMGSYLIKPTQRLGRYILLMEELGKECKKHKIDDNEVKEAIEMLKTEMRLGNDLMAFDAIKGCDMDLKDQGDLIYRNEFTVYKGAEPAYKAMVFLFDKIMMFTRIVFEINVDVLYYQDFIYLKDIGLTEWHNDPKRFKVWFHKHTLNDYTLQTANKATKEKWVSQIRTILENELEKTKREQQQTRTLIDLKNGDTNTHNIQIIP